MRKVSLIFGTRPEAIKLCPLILRMREMPDFDVDVCVTAQHREMLDTVLDVFGVVPDADLDLMRRNQTLASFTAGAVEAIYGYLDRVRPELVIIQGDTTTVLCAALAAFYHRIPVGHVEAGLRTGNKYSPFPEEINRKIATQIAEYHFAPTALSRENLLREGVPDERVFVTGNPVIDALHLAVEKIEHRQPPVPGVSAELMAPDGNRPLVLITGHRRENFGPGFESICRAVTTLARKFSHVEFVYPVHLNPNVQEPVFRLMSGIPNIHLIKPLDYLPFVALMRRSTLILTDSGGVQEEAPSLGKPVLVMRDTTERPEAVTAGTVRLTGTGTDAIVDGVTTLLTDDALYAAMARAINPYGDGTACRRIITALQNARW